MRKKEEDTTKDGEKSRLATPSTVPSFSRLTTSQSIKSRVNHINFGSNQQSIPLEGIVKSPLIQKSRALFGRAASLEWFCYEKRPRSHLPHENKRVEAQLFNKVLENYLEGKANFQELMDAKNFPWTLFLTDSVRNNGWINHIRVNTEEGKAEFQTLNNPLSNDNQDIKHHKDDQSGNTGVNTNAATNIDKNKNLETHKNEVKARAKYFFEMLKNVIRERVEYRKEIKEGLEKFFEFHPVNKDEAKFYQNFLSISNEYIRKILNKDLHNSDWNRHYFDRRTEPCFVKTREMKIMREKKSQTKLEDPEARYKSKNDSQRQKSIAHLFFFSNANKFVDQMRNEIVEEKKVNQVQEQELKNSLINGKNSFRRSVFFSKNDKQRPSTEGGMARSRASGAQPNEFDKNPRSSIMSKRGVKASALLIESEVDEYLKETNLRSYLKGMPDKGKILKSYEEKNNPFIKDISDLDNFNLKYMNDVLEKFENMHYRYSIYQRKKSHPETAQTIRKLKNKFFTNSHQIEIPREQGFFNIKRNNIDSAYKEDLNCAELSDDSEMPSLTEATLDALYNESTKIQNRIVMKRKDGVGKRLKQYLKLNILGEHISSANRNKLSTKNKLYF